MALKLVDVEILSGLIQQLPKPVKILSFGHPDILATPDELNKSLGIKVSVDNKRVRKERIGESDENCIGAAFEVFEILGAELTALDQRNSFGIEEVFDFNLPLELKHFDKYNIVLDPGTLEHVFNVGMGLENVLNALKVNGFVFHINPLNMFNHGYWNFSPITYRDFYEANGFEIIRLDGRRKNDEVFEISYGKRFKGCPGNSMLVCVAKRLEKKPFVIWPMQNKYITTDI